MKIIKTIHHKNIDDFDVEVNNELSNGWTLTWRAAQVYNGDVHLFAGLEKKVSSKHTCNNCRHHEKSLDDEPCFSCDSENDKWEMEE